MTSISAGFPNLKIHIFFEKLDFLRDRPQRVSVNGYNYMSEEVVLISGARQWCVLSPMLFSIIYELHEFALNCCSLTCLFKFANDMALFGLLLNEDSLATCFSHVSLLNEWCKESFLETNAGKTKWLMLNARTNLTTNVFVPVKRNNEPIEVVSNFKYLSSVIDNKLSFSDNIDIIYKK